MPGAFATFGNGASDEWTTPAIVMHALGNLDQPPQPLLWVGNAASLGEGVRWMLGGVAALFVLSVYARRRGWYQNARVMLWNQVAGMALGVTLMIGGPFWMAAHASRPDAADLIGVIVEGGILVADSAHALYSARREKQGGRATF